MANWYCFVVAALFCAFLGQLPLTVESLVPDAPSQTTNARRMFLKATFASVTTAAVIAPTAARSLDMDAFASQQLSRSTQGGDASSSSALSEDQALKLFANSVSQVRKKERLVSALECRQNQVKRVASMPLGKWIGA